MKDALVWSQAGKKYAILTKEILSIEGDSKVDYCKILVSYSDEPIDVSLNIDEVLQKLNIENI
ncbi:MAG: hypothetical protein ACOVOQ_14575 [Flavobacterium sp.]